LTGAIDAIATGVLIGGLHLNEQVLGLTVNCLAPGWFRTAQNRVMYDDAGWVDYLCERIPLARPGAPGDLDGTLVWLASDASAYVTGQTILVDGGISVGAVRAVPKK
jgi:NAD(P)-dependent dehydrogenase (short-subunit alcohol dehydrogenase family)